MALLDTSTPRGLTKRSAFRPTGTTVVMMTGHDVIMPLPTRRANVCQQMRPSAGARWRSPPLANSFAIHQTAITLPRKWSSEGTVLTGPGKCTQDGSKVWYSSSHCAFGLEQVGTSGDGRSESMLGSKLDIYPLFVPPNTYYTLVCTRQRSRWSGTQGEL